MAENRYLLYNLGNNPGSCTPINQIRRLYCVKSSRRELSGVYFNIHMCGIRLRISNSDFGQIQEEQAVCSNLRGLNDSVCVWFYGLP